MHNETQAKVKIEKIIKSFRMGPNYLDVPMIAKHRVQDYMNELTEQDVWAIFNYDLEYGKF
jgi:hypothetical protein